MVGRARPLHMVHFVIGLISSLAIIGRIIPLAKSVWGRKGPRLHGFGLTVMSFLTRCLMGFRPGFELGFGRSFGVRGDGGRASREERGGEVDGGRGGLSYHCAHDALGLSRPAGWQLKAALLHTSSSRAPCGPRLAGVGAADSCAGGACPLPHQL